MTAEIVPKSTKPTIEDLRNETVNPNKETRMYRLGRLLSEVYQGAGRVTAEAAQKILARANAGKAKLKEVFDHRFSRQSAPLEGIDRLDRGETIGAAAPTVETSPASPEAPAKKGLGRVLNEKLKNIIRWFDRRQTPTSAPVLTEDENAEPDFMQGVESKDLFPNTEGNARLEAETKRSGLTLLAERARELYAKTGKLSIPEFWNKLSNNPELLESLTASGLVALLTAASGGSALVALGLSSAAMGVREMRRRSRADADDSRLDEYRRLVFSATGQALPNLSAESSPSDADATVVESKAPGRFSKLRGVLTNIGGKAMGILTAFEQAGVMVALGPQRKLATIESLAHKYKEARNGIQGRLLNSLVDTEAAIRLEEYSSSEKSTSTFKLISVLEDAIREISALRNLELLGFDVPKTMAERMGLSKNLNGDQSDFAPTPEKLAEKLAQWRKEANDSNGLLNFNTERFQKIADFAEKIENPRLHRAVSDFEDQLLALTQENAAVEKLALVRQNENKVVAARIFTHVAKGIALIGGKELISRQADASVNIDSQPAASQPADEAISVDTQEPLDGVVEQIQQDTSQLPEVDTSAPLDLSPPKEDPLTVAVPDLSEQVSPDSPVSSDLVEAVSVSPVDIDIDTTTFTYEYDTSKSSWDNFSTLLYQQVDRPQVPNGVTNLLKNAFRDGLETAQFDALGNSQIIPKIDTLFAKISSLSEADRVAFLDQNQSIKNLWQLGPGTNQALSQNAQLIQSASSFLQNPESIAQLDRVIDNL